VCHCLFSSSLESKNHYQVLGVPSSATHDDIKSAYYKLSKKYHPDMNEGSREAADKFRLITAAYEVLGNYNSRKRYDRGLFEGGWGAPGPTSSGPHFYSPPGSINIQKTRMTTGKAPIYDFDEWARLHYGDTFQRRASAKQRYEQRMRDKVATKHEKSEAILFTIVALFLSYIGISLTFNQDLDKRRPPRKSGNSD